MRFYIYAGKGIEILAGTERMTFEDFDRLAYITDFLGLDQMNLAIWNQFSRSLADSSRR